MAHEVLGKCPVCGEPLGVVKLRCLACRTEVGGDFKLCNFCRLPKEQRVFAEIFIKNKGNIREVEKELGISYPTVRSRLEALIKGLGHDASADLAAEKASKADQRSKVLDMLGKGEISPSDAVKKIEEIGHKHDF